MSNRLHPCSAGSVQGRIPLPLLGGLLLGALLWLALPAGAQAQSPDTTEPTITKPCSSCHSEEADAWLASPHADVADPDTGRALATCTTCHGAYVRGHPDEAVEPLVVDSSSCQECHAETFAQWENSIHGEEGVQCISCHLVHSQDMRLTDERLCTSCHREAVQDPLHEAHWQNDTACTDCHMAGSSVEDAALASSGDWMAMATAPTHDFVTVSADKCLDCHREDVRGAAGAAPVVEIKAAAATRVEDAQLAQAQQTNRSLTVLSLANLGFGVGIGGLLGIVFMVAYARFVSRREP